MQTPVLLAPTLILVGMILLTATEIGVLYWPKIQVVGAVFGIFFTIIGIRLQFTNDIFSALPTGLDIVSALLLQVALGVAIFLAVHLGMQRAKPYLVERLNPPYPNQ